MAYRNDVEALAARSVALEAQVTAATKDLAETKQLLAEAERRARLPVLDNIRVAAPCAADWAGMTGDDRVRACGACKKNVYNLTEMTRAEAEALIVEKEGKLCVRYFQRHDGTILLKDCTIGVRNRRRRRLVVAGVAITIAGGVFAKLSAMNDAVHTMGMISPPNGTMMMGGSAAANLPISDDPATTK